MSLVAITGAAGTVGKWVAGWFLRHGYAVIEIERDKPVEVVGLAGVKLLVHCACEKDGSALAMNVSSLNMTVQAIEACVRDDVRAMIYLSSVHADEYMATSPTPTWYSGMKLASEELVRAWAYEEDARVAIIRLGAFPAPGVELAPSCERLRTTEAQFDFSLVDAVWHLTEGRSDRDLTIMPVQSTS